ncbi:hypothetical protein CBR_g2910 [Chara braunii]|nr:hypothetical protein CBR_g2910 [Chara braunii]|eukprot:GBG68367.1 hypothetical protein CBR_g2910 [Chara braunii]
MMVDSDGNQTKIDDVSGLVEGSKFDGEESAEGSNLAAVVKTKAAGRGKGGQQRSQGQAANPNKIAAWVRAGLDQEVWQYRWSHGACINCDYLGALISEFGLSEDVTRSLDEAYKEDPITMDIINKLQAKDKATTDEFVMVDGLLFPEKAGFKRLVVPSRETLRSLFLGERHDATGHFDYKKTSANLVQRFWWPNMLDDVKKYVETCQVCQRDKLRTQAPLGLLKPLPIPAGPGQSISMDFMDTLVTRTQAPLGLLKPLPIPAGPGQSISMDFMDTLVTSKNGKRHIFVIVDRFTKYARLIASTSSSCSWTIGTTGVSPDQLHLGWKPRSSLDFLLPENRTAAAPGTIEFGVQYEKLLQQTVEHTKKSQEAMIGSENKRRRQSTFQVGERVWVKASELGQEFGISRKLMPQYFGPWEVLDIVGNDLDGPSYVIRIPGHLRTYPVFHASKLAPFAETAQFPSRRSMLSPTMDDHVDVDDILDHRDTPVPKPPGRGRPPKPAREYRVDDKEEAFKVAEREEGEEEDEEVEAADGRGVDVVEDVGRGSVVMMVVVVMKMMAAVTAAAVVMVGAVRVVVEEEGVVVVMMVAVVATAAVEAVYFPLPTPYW